MRVVVPGIAVGWVTAEGCRVEPSSRALLDELQIVIARAIESKDSPLGLSRKDAARDMLRFGKYKPTGRGKPASEYLLNAAVEGRFPVINNLVDINNLVSVECLLPISVVDMERAGSRAFDIRRGRAGEEYVFNPSGQVLTLQDLLLTSKLPEDVPCASPIKDCQATKTHDATREVLAIIYAPASQAHAAKQAAARMASLMVQFCGASAESGLAEYSG